MACSVWRPVQRWRDGIAPHHPPKHTANCGAAQDAQEVLSRTLPLRVPGPLEVRSAWSEVPLAHPATMVARRELGILLSLPPSALETSRALAVLARNVQHIKGESARDRRPASLYLVHLRTFGVGPGLSSCLALKVLPRLPVCFVTKVPGLDHAAAAADAGADAEVDAEAGTGTGQLNKRPRGRYPTRRRTQTCIE